MLFARLWSQPWPTRHQWVLTLNQSCEFELLLYRLIRQPSYPSEFLQQPLPAKPWDMIQLKWDPAFKGNQVPGPLLLGRVLRELDQPKGQSAVCRRFPDDQDIMFNEHNSLYADSITFSSRSASLPEPLMFLSRRTAQQYYWDPKTCYSINCVAWKPGTFAMNSCIARDRHGCVAAGNRCRFVVAARNRYRFLATGFRHSVDKICRHWDQLSRKLCRCMHKASRQVSWWLQVPGI